MALTWGAWQYGGGNGMRVGLDEYGGTGVSSGSTTWSFSVNIWTGNQYNYNDNQTLNYSNSISGSFAYNNTQATGTSTHRHTQTVTYTYPAGSYGTSPGTLYVTAQVAGAYNNVTPFHTIGVAIPARPAPPPPEYPPYAPTGVTAVRNSDVQATVSGTHPVDAQHDVNTMTIQQRTYSGAAWGAWATVYTGTGTSRAVTGLSANHIYGFQMRLDNSLGSSAFVAASSDVYMTPAAPTLVSAVLVGDDIRLDWTSSAYTSSTVTHKIERSVSGGAWTALTSGIPRATLSYTDTSPAVGVNKYRVATVTSTGALSSAWVESDEVELVAVDCWLWDGATEIPLTAHLWNGTTTVPLDLEFIQARSS